jgi:hypothetical protein
MAKKQNTLINGIAYSYVDMSVSIAGVNPVLYAGGFVGIPVKSISYDSTQTKTANYENSKYATSYSYGKVEFAGSLTFTLDSLEFLRDRIYELTSSSRSILDLPACDITITYANKGKINVHTIKNAVFTTEKCSGSEGDATFAVSCDFIASFINYGDISSLGTAAVSAAIIKEATDDNQITLP